MKVLWSYRYIEEAGKSPELGQYRTYGLQVGRETADGFVLIECIRDVTAECRLAQNMVETFNRCQLSPLHFREAVADNLP